MPNPVLHKGDTLYSRDGKIKGKVLRSNTHRCTHIGHTFGALISTIEWPNHTLDTEVCSEDVERRDDNLSSHQSYQLK